MQILLVTTLNLSSIRLNYYENTRADGANGSLINSTIAVSLKHLSNF